MHTVNTPYPHHGLQQVQDLDVDYWLEQASQDARHFVRPLQDFNDKIVERLNGRNVTGLTMPWGITHDLVRFRPKEVSVFAGINGHGKSQILGQITAWILPQTPAMVASFEMPCEATGARMVRQCAGMRDPSRQFVERFTDWSFGHLWMYEEERTITPKSVYALVCYAARELGVKFIVIDSLLKCGIAGDDMNGQKQFIDTLCQMAKRYEVHIALVHHMRKGEREGKRPDKFDVRGASEIVDLVDNLFIIHRNKDKERRLMMREEVDPGVPDAVLNVAKQRHGEWEGEFMFWFDRDSQQYVKSPDAGPLPWPSPEDRWLAKWANG